MAKVGLRPDLISVAEAGKLLGVNRKTAWRFIDEGRLRAFRYSREWLVDKDSVLALKNKREGGEEVAEDVGEGGRVVTKTYVMEDIECPSCGVLFSLPVDVLADLDKRGEVLTCPACGEGIELEEDEDEDESEDEEEAEAAES